MKKKLCVALLGLMVVGMTACGKQGTGTPEPVSVVSTNTAVEETPVEVEEEVVEEETVVEETVEEPSAIIKVDDLCVADSRRLKGFNVSLEKPTAQSGLISFASVYAVAESVQVEDKTYSMEEFFVPKDNIWSAVALFIPEMDCQLNYISEKTEERVENIGGEDTTVQAVVSEVVDETVTAGSKSLADFKTFCEKKVDGADRGLDVEEYYFYEFAFVTETGDTFYVEIETKNNDGTDIISYSYNIVTADNMDQSESIHINALDSQPLYFRSAGCSDSAFSYEALAE